MSLVLNIRNCNPSNKKRMFVRMPLPFPAFITGQRYLLTNNSIRKNTVRKSIELFSFFFVYYKYSLFTSFPINVIVTRTFPFLLLYSPFLNTYLYYACEVIIVKYDCIRQLNDCVQLFHHKPLLALK